MRILTVRQPYASAIIYVGKDVENRRTNIAGSWRGPVAIHAGKTWDFDAEFPTGNTPELSSRTSSTFMVFGAIIGVVDLVDVHCDGVGSCRGTPRLGICSQWAEPAVWHLTLSNPRPLAAPITYRGARGLRTLDDATTARVLEAVTA